MMGRRVARRTARRTSRRAGGQQDQAAPAEPEPQQEPAPEEPQATGPSEDSLAELKQLGELHDSGVLTDEEFTQQKEKILGS